MNTYKFVTWDVPEVRTDITFEWVKECYNSKYHTWLQNLLEYGCIKNMGWCYSFKEELNKYVYKQYGQWREVYAPNKTLLRKAIYGKVDKILEVK